MWADFEVCARRWKTLTFVVMNAVSSPPLLITSAVIPSDPTVALKNIDLRISYTLDAIARWFDICPNVRIVICDGSNYDFGPVLSRQFAGKYIETLHFRNDAAKVEEFGKGYGEGEIINFALANSRTITSTEYFAKCTSKLWVNNFHECLKSWNGSMLFQAKISNILKNKPLIFRHIDTRFYLIRKSLYFQHFSDVHLRVNDAADFSLEHCFREKIQQIGFAGYLFSTPLDIEGYSGSTADYFNTNWIGNMSEHIKLKVLSWRTNMVSAHA